MAVPVEVLAFGHRSTARMLERSGELGLRMRAGTPWMSAASWAGLR